MIVMLQMKIIPPLISKSVKRQISEFLNVNTDTQFYKTPIPEKFQQLPFPLYGGFYTITTLPGTGISPELMDHVKNVLAIAPVNLNFEEITSPTSVKDEDNELYRITSSVFRNRVALKGSIEVTSKGAGMSQHNMSMRSKLDLYIAIIHCRAYPHVKCLNPGIDCIIARQNTEGDYLMLEHEAVKGNVEALKVVTRHKTEQYAIWALNYARAHRRKKVTIVHKEDIYVLADGIFVKTVLEQARDFRDLRFETMRLTPFIEKLLRRPEVFDFVMIPNLYGSSATNLICGALGGAGLLSKKSYSNYCAVFEPAVGDSAPHLKGKDCANPVAMLNAARDMLSYLRMYRGAGAIDYAVKRTLCHDKIQTPDIGGTATTSEFIDRVKYYVGSFM
ncbi:hypothetical protein WA026_011352 [Henosepilachna vigintioctopunctata]|uniref:Isopropylmalate dehydrogenase-like domain-containing protein n=1 Tax=Henosepilachna vigintioctopunctata TaxID=420089 RepID=A0AAW1TSF4_9CUCU